ncbi:hypothetical protein AYI70_g1448 [Smittium culicis]|uniref:Uncharacterized protein n=1 Tax=Smittium culicis TaxID=133412 RepID=A0A1R1YCM0_9FUNG|nr:hypothetical protein AYI70_g1448 [Smittium culicis]
MVSSTKADDAESDEISEFKVFEHTYNGVSDELDDDPGALDVRQFVQYMDSPCAGRVGPRGVLLAARRVPALQQNPRHSELLHLWACDRYSDVAAHPVRFIACKSFCQGRWQHAVVPSWRWC